MRAYSQSRHALVRLGAGADVLAKYRVLRDEDTKVSTAVIDVRKPSRAEATLAWFWRMDVQRDTENDSWMAERELFYFFSVAAGSNGFITPVYRVHWLRSKAKFDRAREQQILVPYEMRWTTAYFRKQAQVWAERKSSLDGSDLGNVGLICYADRQIEMWTSFKTFAATRFSSAL